MSNGIRVGQYVLTSEWGTKPAWNKKPPGSPPPPSSTKEYRKEWRSQNKDKIRGYHLKYAPPLSEMVLGYVPMNARKDAPPPPCGGDCENCPFDDGCRYPDDLEDVYVAPNGRKQSRENRRRANQSHYEKQKAMMAADPDFAAFVHEKRKKKDAKARAKNRFVKAGGTPEEFEKKWRRDHE